MSELDIRLWPDNQSVTKTFLSIAKVLEAHDACAKDWGRLKVTRSLWGSELLEEKTFSIDRLPELIKDHDQEDKKIIAYVSLNFWRVSPKGYQLSPIYVYFSAWGSKHANNHGLSLERFGNAQISITETIPFYVHLSPKTDIQRKNNEYTEKKLEILFSLIHDLIILSSPKQILAYTDDGEYLLHNSHITYFENYSILESTLSKYVLMLQKGDSLGLRTATEMKGELDNIYYHPLRPIEFKQELAERLVNASEMDNLAFSRKNLNQVLASGKYDFFEREESLLILEFPHISNSFNDRFFLDLLGV